MDLVSVILPVYNSEKYIFEAIESVLNQTYKNIEIIVIDDCSTDTSAEIINNFNDNRIRYYKNEKNSGIVYSLNRAISLAKGKYLARMDSDDICLPNRIQEQVNFLNIHPEILIVSSWFMTFGDAEGIVKYCCDPDEIKCKLLYSLQLLHPGWMFRRDLFEKYNLFYREEYRHAEDWDLLVRASKVSKLANVNKVLIKYRLNQNQVSHVYNDEQRDIADRISYNQLSDIGIDIDVSNFKIYRKYFGAVEKIITKAHFHQLIYILKSIETQNIEKCFYNKACLRKIISQELLLLSYFNLINKNKAVLKIVFTKYIFYSGFSFVFYIKFCLRLIYTLFFGSLKLEE